MLHHHHCRICGYVNQNGIAVGTLLLYFRVTFSFCGVIQFYGTSYNRPTSTSTGQQHYTTSKYNWFNATDKQSERFYESTMKILLIRKPIPLNLCSKTFLSFSNKNMAMAILPPTAFYPWRLFCRETFVIGQF